MKDNRKKIFKTKLKSSLDPNPPVDPLNFDYIKFTKNLIVNDFSLLIANNTDIPNLELKEGGITSSIQTVFAEVNDVTTAAVSEIVVLKEEPYIIVDQPKIKFAITENTIDLKTLSQLNPNIFSYDNGRKICSLIKNINLMLL